MTGTGLIDDPYLISTPEDIILFFDRTPEGVRWYGKLINNIDCRRIEWNVAPRWNFDGGHTLDLNGYYISNIYCINSLGLFGTLNAPASGNKNETIIKNGQLLHMFFKNSSSVAIWNNSTYGSQRVVFNNVAMEIYADGLISSVIGDGVDLISCNVEIIRNKSDFITLFNRYATMKDTLFNLKNIHIPLLTGAGNVFAWIGQNTNSNIVDCKITGKVYNLETDTQESGVIGITPGSSSTGIVWELDTTDVIKVDSVSPFNFNTANMINSKNNIINIDKTGGHFDDINTNRFIKMTEEQITSPVLTNNLGFTTIDITEGGGK